MDSRRTKDIWRDQKAGSVGYDGTIKRLAQRVFSSLTLVPLRKRLGVYVVPNALWFTVIFLLFGIVGIVITDVSSNYIIVLICNLVFLTIIAYTTIKFSSSVQSVQVSLATGLTQLANILCVASMYGHINHSFEVAMLSLIASFIFTAFYLIDLINIILQYNDRSSQINILDHGVDLVIILFCVIGFSWFGLWIPLREAYDQFLALGFISCNITFVLYVKQRMMAYPDFSFFSIFAFSALFLQLVFIALVSFDAVSPAVLYAVNLFIGASISLQTSFIGGSNIYVAKRKVMKKTYFRGLIINILALSTPNVVALLEGPKPRFAGILAALIIAAIHVRMVVFSSVKSEQLEQIAREERNLLEETIFDHLTGLFNENGIRGAVDKMMTSSNGHISLVVIDLDGFKAINQTYGHTVGDDIIVIVAGRISSELREGDYAARVDGDKFIILLDGIMHPESALALATRHLEAVKGPCVLGSGLVVPVGASAGVALSGDSETDLFERAASALSTAKRISPGAVQLSESSYGDNFSWSISRESLVKLFDSGVIGIKVSPLVNLKTNRPEAMYIRPDWDRAGSIEALVSYHGLEIQWLNWLFENAFSWSKRANARVHLTVSDEQLRHESMVEILEKNMHSSNVSPESIVICVEANTSLVHNDIPDCINALRNKGIKVALDNFGVAGSGFREITSLPIDYLKISPELTSRLVSDPKFYRLAEAITEISAIKGIEIVGRGIDTSVIRDKCFELGFAYGQGRHWGQLMTGVEALIYWRYNHIESAGNE